jgi:hypothetical protein
MNLLNETLDSPAFQIMSLIHMRNVDFISSVDAFTEVKLLLFFICSEKYRPQQERQIYILSIMTRKRMKVIGSDSENDICENISDPGVPLLGNVTIEIFTQNILPFVGKNQYRFVGGVNRHFRISYLTFFSPSTSFENVTTVGQAYLCSADLSLKRNAQKAAFCEVMVKNGRQSIVKYLFSLECRSNNTLTDHPFTATAAEAGHFELLRWLVRQKCAVDAATFAGAAVHGDLVIFQWLYSLPRAPDYNYFDGSPWRGIPWNEKAYENAALYGHLPILEWSLSKERRSPYLSQLCSLAAVGYVNLRHGRSEREFRIFSMATSDRLSMGRIELYQCR